MPHMRQSR